MKTEENEKLQEMVLDAIELIEQRKYIKTEEKLWEIIRELRWNNKGE